MTHVKDRYTERCRYEPDDDQQDDGSSLTRVEALVPTTRRPDGGVVVDTESGQREDTAGHGQHCSIANHTTLSVSITTRDTVTRLQKSDSASAIV